MPGSSPSSSLAPASYSADIRLSHEVEDIGRTLNVWHDQLGARRVYSHCYGRTSARLHHGILRGITITISSREFNQDAGEANKGVTHCPAVVTDHRQSAHFLLN